METDSKEKFSKGNGKEHGESGIGRDWGQEERSRNLLLVGMRMPVRRPEKRIFRKGKIEVFLPRGWHWREEQRYRNDEI